MRRFIASLVIIVLSATAPATAQEPDAFPTGRYSMIMADTTSQLHRAILEFTKDGHYFITHRVTSRPWAGTPTTALATP